MVSVNSFLLRTEDISSTGIMSIYDETTSRGSKLTLSEQPVYTFFLSLTRGNYNEHATIILLTHTYALSMLFYDMFR